MDPLPARELVWTALISKWIDFARSSAGFPDTEEGSAWRASVVSVIELQAVTFALADLRSVEAADRPFCRDRAELMIAVAARQLEAAWGRVPMPDMILELLQDAGVALEASVYAGTIELWWPGPGPLRVPALSAPKQLSGTLLVMAPGTIAFPDQPVAWWTNEVPQELRTALHALPERVTDRPGQVYRGLDAAGRFTGDHLSFVLEAPPPGMPLLVPLFEHGRTIGGFLRDADEWFDMQRRAGVPFPEHQAETSASVH